MLCAAVLWPPIRGTIAQSYPATEVTTMKIALIIENSQAAKSEIVHDALKSVAEPLGHQVHHYGMYGPRTKPRSPT